MIGRAIGCLLMSCAALCSAVLYPLPLPITAQATGTGLQRQNAKPQLIVVHSQACGPCQVFAAAFVQSRSLRETLQSHFDVRQLNWDMPSERADAQRLGVERLPTFLVLRSGRLVATHVGFAGANTPAALQPAVADLMRDLQVPWPPAASRPPIAAPSPGGQSPRPESPQTQPPVQTVPPATGSRGASGLIDEQARDGIAELKQQAFRNREWQSETQQAVEQLQTQVGGIRADLSESSKSITEQIRRSQESTRSEVSSVSKQLQESVRRTIDEHTTRHDSTSTQQLPPAEPPRQSGLGGWLLRIGLTAGAASLGLPVGAAGVAAGVVGWLIGRRRARRPPVPAAAAADCSTGAESVTVVRDTETRRATANHYVVKETDRVGEAYKEALRRVVAAYKSDKPGIVDVASQIEHVAHELLRGQDVQARSTVPRPGLWTDEG